MGWIDWLQFIASDGTIYSNSAVSNADWTGIAPPQFVFTADPTTNEEGIVRATLASNIVVMGLTVRGFMGDVSATFKAGTEITFDADENILSGTLVGDDGTDATHFRRINDVNYIFITITPTMGEITEGTFMDGTNTVTRYFRTINDVRYVFTSVVTGADGRITGTLAEEITVTVGSDTYTFASNEEISFYDDGSLKEGILASTSPAVTLNGNTYTFLADPSFYSISFYADGSVEKGALSSDQAVTQNGGAYTFKGASEISFYDDGVVKEGRLATNDAVWTNNDVVYTFLGNNPILFHTNGSVEEGNLAANVVWTNNMVAYTFRSRIYFHANGVVKQGTLAANIMVTLNEVVYTFRRFGPIFFAMNGNVIQGQLAAAVDTDGDGTNEYNQRQYLQFLAANGVVHSHGSSSNAAWEGVILPHEVGSVAYVFLSVERIGGNIISGVLAEEKTVTVGSNTYMFAVNGEISFYDDGSVKEGILATNKAVTLNNVAYTFKADRFNSISFYANGAVKQGTLASNSPAVTLNEVAYSFGGNSAISFYENGAVEQGRLRANIMVTLNGVEYTFRSFRTNYFYENGAVKRGTLSSTSPAVRLNGVDYTFSSFEEIYFAMNGVVIQGRLNAAVDTDGDGTNDYSRRQWLQFLAADGTVHSHGSAADPDWTGGSVSETRTYNNIQFTFTGAPTTDGEGIVHGTLASDVVVSNLMGTGFTGDITFKSGTEITFDAAGVIQSGTLIGDVSMVPTIFRRINDVNYVFQTFDMDLEAGRVGGSAETYYQGGRFYTFSAAPMFHSGDMVVSEGTLSGATVVTLGGEAYRFGIAAFADSLEIEFHSNGRVKEAFFGLPTKELTLNGVTYTFTSRFPRRGGSDFRPFHFNDSGALIQGSLATPSSGYGRGIDVIVL